MAPDMRVHGTKTSRIRATTMGDGGAELFLQSESGIEFAVQGAMHL
jgi:filamentous hemagglutinin family protein